VFHDVGRTAAPDAPGHSAFLPLYAEGATAWKPRLPMKRRASISVPPCMFSMKKEWSV
jgi:hypothetical protein